MRGGGVFRKPRESATAGAELARLLSLALAPWCPAAHQWFPARFRAVVNITVRVCFLLQKQQRRIGAAAARRQFRRRRRVEEEEGASSSKNEEMAEGASGSSGGVRRQQQQLHTPAPPLEFWLEVLSFCDRDAWSGVSEGTILRDRWLV